MRAPKTPLALFEVARCGLLLVCCSHTSAQTTSNAPPVQYPAVPADPTEPEKPWTFSASVYAYFPPNAGDYLQPTLTADHESLHLEARYNYEALDSGSVWIGYNFSGGHKLEWQFSPMLGGIFGQLTGVAPGYEGSSFDIDIFSSEPAVHRGDLTPVRSAAGPIRRGSDTFYVIPGCYLGNRPPSEVSLPPGCDPNKARRVK